jgi:glycosyltransferase involved in cell wall biosynthesis
MALGKPVICYMKPFALENHPDDLPIVNANMDNLEAVLADLLRDGEKRYALGRAGRSYIEKYHDASKIAEKLVEIYEGLL